MMRIRRLDTDRKRDVRQFVRFPFQLYRSSPHWVPPLISQAETDLNRSKHPFYRRSAADFYVLEGDGQTLGRIAVMDNRDYNEYRGSHTAFFGLFDVVEDVGAARRLFEAAFDWARARGLDRLLGPRGLRGVDASGVLVEGFEHRAAMGMPYNYPYYNAAVCDSGFVKDTDHLSGYLSGRQELDGRWFAVADKVKARHGLWVKSFASKEEMRRWVPNVTRVYREAFRDNHVFYPPTDEEIAQFADDLIAIADPRLIKLVMREDEIVGFAFAYHDVTAGLQKARGQLWPIGWVHLARERRRAEWGNFNGVGVLPGYQGRGASILLYTEMFKSAREIGFHHADIVQVDEVNLKSRTDMEALGVRWYKRHRSYQREL